MPGHTFNIANSENMTAYLTKVFGDIELGVQEAVNESIDKIGKETSKRVREASPKKTGKYAKGWRYRARKMQPDGSFSAVVYNAKYGWMTHLIENGHPIVSKGSVVRTVKPRPHIKPVNDWVMTEGIKILTDAIQKEIKNLKT